MAMAMAMGTQALSKQWSCRLLVAVNLLACMTLSKAIKNPVLFKYRVFTER